MFERELSKLSDLYKKGLFIKPYYSERINGKYSFSSYDEFIKIPFMDKDSIRNTSVYDRTNTEMKDVYGVFSSSGTTGRETFYIYNKNDKKVHEEFVRTFFNEFDINENDLGGIMAPVGTEVMGHTMLWEFSTVGAGYVNCPVPTPENILNTVSEVPVTVIATRPNIASSVAYKPEWVEAARNSKVKKLTLGGGFLSSQRRKLLEETWDAEVYNLLGMSEMFGPMAAECHMKNGLHYLNEYLMIELINPITKMPVKEGEPGIAVYTTLWEKGFPLLRYWTDDLMTISYEKCECGSINPRLHYLGRMADCFIIDGDFVFPEQVENILFSNGLIGEYKVSMRNDKFYVSTEFDGEYSSSLVVGELNNLFKSEVEFITCSIGSLNYHGFGKRFSVEEISNG